nr:hypothetical protein BaRGS_017344 [Batillaria attramentaria]
MFSVGMLRLVTSRVLLGLTVVVTVLCFYMGRHLLGGISRQGAVVSLVNYGKVSYCMVPKVGCTFWINVFRFFSMSQGTPPEHLLSDFRFMFVRDPWSRLWSAYLDKFLLIDFWRTDGQQIVRRRKVKDASTRCARDVSFKEFVDFVVTSNPANLNPHWKPVQLQCSPCLYRPHVIGKMETFSQDVRFVLDKLDMTWMMDNYTHDAHVHGEMDMLIDYNFHMLGADFFKACTNATDLARRLWKTFQYNGYLPIESPFPEGQALSMTVPRFKSLNNIKTLSMIAMVTVRERERL